METVSPEDVGFSSDRLSRVNELSRRYVDEGKLAGLVTMLARGGKTFHFQATGGDGHRSGQAHGAGHHLPDLLDDQAHHKRRGDDAS